jgi:nitroreductase
MSSWQKGGVQEHSTRPVEKSKLLSILEAARWAPSSCNEQAWRYIVFTNENPEKLKKAQSVLKDIYEYARERQS